MKKLSFLLMGILWAAPTLAKPHQSDITFGRSEKLQTTTAKKRNFKQDVESLMKSHDTWKKAHLAPALYSCQHNGERVAALAKQVADKIEASEKATTTQAKALEKVVAQAVEEDEIPEVMPAEKAAILKTKLKELQAAQKNSQVLERLSGQVMNFYKNDVPKQTAFGGSCATAYPAALKKGVTTSQQYHSDAEALNQKLTKLAGAAKTALRAMERAMVAGR